MDHIPNKFEMRRAALVAEIYAAFADVKLGNGVSWSQAYEVDRQYSLEAIKAARSRDTDKHWSELVDDPNWHPFPGMGGFVFIDMLGFRYYLPVAMIRMLWQNCEWFPGHMLDTIMGKLGVHPPPMLNAAQNRCVAKFVRFMAERAKRKKRDEPRWQDSLDTFWYRYLHDD